MQTNNPPLHLQEQEIENAFLALEEDFYQIDMLLNNYRFSWSHLAFHFKNAWLDIKLHLDGIDKSRSLDTLNSEFEAIYIELVDALNALETKILL